MDNLNPTQPNWLKKGSIFLLFLIVQTLVFAKITFSPYVPRNVLLTAHIGLTVVLLVVALLLRRTETLKTYWPVFFAFFVAGSAVWLSDLLSDDLLALFGLRPNNPQGIAAAKFFEAILQGIPILVLMPLAGFNYRSLYLQRGKVKVWLPVGLAALIVIPLAAYLPLAGQPGAAGKLLSLWPWILVFVLSNGFMEELVYRGLFLQRYEPFLGKGASLVLTALVFTLMHTQVTYAAQMVQFIAIVLVLSLIWGFLIQKADSLWGAVLFHAAADCLIIFPAFISL